MSRALALLLPVAALAAACGSPCEAAETCSACVAVEEDRCVWIDVRDDSSRCIARGAEADLDVTSRAEVAQECGPRNAQ